MYSFSLLAIMSDWALLFLRVILGFLFLAHGTPKIKDLRATGSNFDAMGFKPGMFWGPLVAVAEFFGGLAILLGVGTQAAAFVLAAEFVVIAVWKFMRHESFVGGTELDLIILASLLVLLTLGGGVYSLDGRFFGGY